MRPFWQCGRRQDALPASWEKTEGPPEGLGGIGRLPQKARKGCEALSEGREGSRVSPERLGGVGRPFQRVGAVSRLRQSAGDYSGGLGVVRRPSWVARRGCEARLKGRVGWQALPDGGRNQEALLEGQEALLEGQEATGGLPKGWKRSGGPSGGVIAVRRPYQLAGRGQETVPEDQEALPEDPEAFPEGRGRRTSLRTGKGQETLQVVWEQSGGPPGGLGVVQRPTS